LFQINAWRYVLHVNAGNISYDTTKKQLSVLQISIASAAALGKQILAGNRWF